MLDTIKQLSKTDIQDPLLKPLSQAVQPCQLVNGAFALSLRDAPKIPIALIRSRALAGKGIGASAVNVASENPPVLTMTVAPSSRLSNETPAPGPDVVAPKPMQLARAVRQRLLVTNASESTSCARKLPAVIDPFVTVNELRSWVSHLVASLVSMKLPPKALGKPSIRIALAAPVASSRRPSILPVAVPTVLPCTLEKENAKSKVDADAGTAAPDNPSAKSWQQFF
ncbi:MAG: hypothetical protein AB8B58_16780 [Roseobacter sp.]